MWTAQRGRGSQREETATALIGGVTLADIPLGVYVDGERRNLPIFSPSGYRWKPNVGDSVLVMKTEEGGCVVGCSQPSDEALSPGEVKISGDGCTIYLNNQGEIAIIGDVTVNGMALETLIERIATQVTASMVY